MKHRKAGFTLAELVIALGLSLLVAVALVRLITMAVSNHMRGFRSSAAQVESALILKAMEHELAGATYLLAPAAAGVHSAKLEGCTNAMSGESGGIVPMDPAKPVGFFAFCPAGNKLHYHSVPGRCPAVYNCGAAPAMTFGGDDHAVTATFTRASERSPVVDVSLTVNSSAHPVSRATSFALAYAVGGTPGQPDAVMGSCSCYSPFVYTCRSYSNQVIEIFGGFLRATCTATGPVGQQVRCSASTLATSTAQALKNSCRSPNMFYFGNEPCSCTAR